MHFSPSVKKADVFQHTLPVPDAQLAVYDSLFAPPRVVHIKADSIRSFLDMLSLQTYEAVKSFGAAVPFVVIREIIENLIHADFKEPVISILEGGTKICISDQGKGIPDKEKALQPGFTTATRWQKSFIRGVGSGLPVANEIMVSSGGKIKIDDNLRHGTVITLLLSSVNKHKNAAQAETVNALSGNEPDTFSHELARALRESLTSQEENNADSSPVQEPHALSAREKKALLVLAELGQAGPSQIAKELHMSIPTAHRELAFLEKYGLASRVRGGKRTLSEKGTKFLQDIFWEQDKL